MAPISKLDRQFGQLAIYPSDLDTLTRLGRLESTRESYLFSGFDRTLCVLLNHRHDLVLEHVVDERFKYLELGFGRGAASWRALHAAQGYAKLVRAARSFGVDAVVAYDPHLLGLVGASLAKQLHVPLAIRLICHYGLVHQETGRLAFAPFRHRAVERLVERWSYRHADKVLVACPSHELYVEEVGKGRAAVLPYVTAQAALFYDDAPTERAILAELAPGASKVVVWVGRLMPEKYPFDVIECAAKLRAGGSDVTVVIVGDGPLRPQVEQRIAELQAPAVLAGLLQAPRIRALLRAADGVIVTQGGGAIIEAALCGAPIATYDFEMNPFVVRPGHDEGILVPFRDTTALAKAVRALVDRPERGRAFGERLQRAARERFSQAAASAAERRIAAALVAAGPRSDTTRRTGALDLQGSAADGHGAGDVVTGAVSAERGSGRISVAAAPASGSPHAPSGAL